MPSTAVDGIWYPGTEYVESVVTSMVPVLFPNYDILEPDFQYLGGDQGRGLLGSSLARPMPYFGEDRFPSLADKAASLIWSIVLNHPFNDGNKRAALTTGFAFLANNHQLLIAHQDEAVEICLRIAAGTPGYTEAFVSRWICEHMVPVTVISEIIADPAKSESADIDPTRERFEDLPADYLRAWVSFYRFLLNSGGLL